MIKYLVLSLFLVSMVLFLFYRNSYEVEFVSLGREQCLNLQKISESVEDYKNAYGYYPLSKADLINSLGGEFKGLYKFTGKWSYLNNYTYQSMPSGYELNFIGPKSGKTIRVKNESDFKSLCSPNNFGEL